VTTRTEDGYPHATTSRNTEWIMAVNPADPLVTAGPTPPHPARQASGSPSAQPDENLGILLLNRFNYGFNISYSKLLTSTYQGSYLVHIRPDISRFGIHRPSGTGRTSTISIDSRTTSLTHPPEFRPTTGEIRTDGARITGGARSRR
jgi:hypothetical protein